ncbi:MAG: T9SS type A sorting domain-containing protein [Saprospiraceae bacterium]|nr:T9SS type A sorting domain-containing protein [Saprospiraceae bacterium]
MPPRSLLILLIISAVSVCTSAQELSNYARVEVRAGEQLDIPVVSTKFPEFLKYPEHGTASKFKYGYESVFRIRYSAMVDFVGLDTIIYQTERTIGGRPVPHFEGFIVQVRNMLATDDYYALSLDQQAIGLQVLANDESNLGDMVISELTYTSSGNAQITSDGQMITFTPEHAGFVSIRYLACSGSDCAAADVLIRVDDKQLEPKGDTLKYVIERDGEITTLVGPGFAEPSSAYYLGTLTKLKNQVFHYRPRQGFTGSEVLKFQQLYEGEKILHIVAIEVVDPFESNGWNHEDRFYTEVGNAVEFSVSQNDLGGDISAIFEDELQGHLVNLDNGRFRFQPNPGFSGQTAFTYESCDDGRCDLAEVLLTVHNYVPLYNEVLWFTTKNGLLRVDYDIPIDEYAFEILSGPSNGTAEISPDGKSITYSPFSGFTGTDALVLRYCCMDDQDCQVIYTQVLVQDIEIIENCYDCVWPGDHNNDGMVDVQDAVVLATNLGFTGPARDHLDDTPFWFGELGHDWPQSFAYGTENLKYADGNGDGMVTLSDLEAINQYYEFAHGLVATPPSPIHATTLNLDLLTPEVQPGEWAIVEVSLGSPSAQVDAMLGLNFSFEVSGRYVDSSSVQFNISKNGIFTPLNSVVAWAKSPRDGRIDVGIGKTDREPITGHGVLGEIRFIVEEDLNGFRSLKDLLDIPISITRIGLLGISGDIASLPTVRQRISLAMKQPATNISLYPNPTGNLIHLTQPIGAYEIFDLQGTRILTGNLTSQSFGSIDVSNLATGIYMLRIKKINGESALLKFEVVH